MTTEELNALVERLDSLSSLNQTSITAAASAIRQLMSEREAALVVIRDIEKWLAKPEWGTWPYTEGDGLYNDRNNAEDMIRIFRSTHPPAQS